MVAKSGWVKGLRPPKRWKLHPALKTLERQIDQQWPGRAKQSDGSIASAYHHKQNPNSDHEPRPLGGKYWVTAVDITHNLTTGIDCNELWAALLANKDSRIKYVIFNKQIFNSPRFNYTGGAKRRGSWNPGPYTGSNAHTKHLHLSVWPEVNASSTVLWAFGPEEERGDC